MFFSNNNTTNTNSNSFTANKRFTRRARHLAVAVNHGPHSLPQPRQVLDPVEAHRMLPTEIRPPEGAVCRRVVKFCRPHPPFPRAWCNRRPTKCIWTVWCTKTRCTWPGARAKRALIHRKWTWMPWSCSSSTIRLTILTISACTWTRCTWTIMICRLHRPFLIR